MRNEIQNYPKLYFQRIENTKSYLSLEKKSKQHEIILIFDCKNSARNVIQAKNTSKMYCLQVSSFSTHVIYEMMMNYRIIKYISYFIIDSRGCLLCKSCPVP